MADEGEAALQFSVASVVEDVLQHHGNRSFGLDLDARRAQEAAMRRYEAAEWLRKMVGVVGARDLPAEPSEEEFRLGLRSGIILCNVINKVQPGAVQKVVEGPYDSSIVQDGAALSAYQYFENVRNLLVAVQEMGIPTFEASDLEQGGKSSRIVNCVLALKSYSEWKQKGEIGVWKFGGNPKPSSFSKQFVPKNEPFISSLSRTMSMNGKSSTCENYEVQSSMSNSSLSRLIRSALLDRKPDEVPSLIESVLSKVVEEFEHRIASHVGQNKAIQEDVSGSKIFSKCSTINKKNGHYNAVPIMKEDCSHNSFTRNEKSRGTTSKQLVIIDQQQLDIKELKQAISTTKSGMQFMQMKFHEEIQNLGVHIHGLAHAASGYHRVLQENRKLYNQVQDLKGSIRVYCRIRPFLSGQSNSTSIVDHIEEGTISVSTMSRNGRGCRSFNFNKVFGPSASQEEVFSDTQPLIRSVLDGYNVCIFAYGQTGSGKTYTMTGPKDLTELNKGVNYRALSDLFHIAEQRKDTFQYDVFVQMIEIYNEQVRDLLVIDGMNKRLEIRNSSQTGFNIPDARLVRVTSSSDVIDLMNIGHMNRAVGATALNDRSSRSHSCLTVHVQGKDLTSGTILRGCMHLVDLAGSERVNKSEVTGERLKEAQHINRSLSALGDVISSLAQKNVHVPYRNSKLTQLLQDSLGGQAKTLMFVHISPEPDAIGETISTLKFAERVATVELGAAHVNKDSADVKELKEQITNLKAALAKKERNQNSAQHMTSGCPPVSPTLSTPLNNMFEYNSQRKPMEDVGNLEVQGSAFIRQKKQSFDLDEILVNSEWPPITSPSQEDDKEIGSGEWIDKVMVNKEDSDHGVTGDSLRCWKTENGNLSDVLYRKHPSEPSTVYPEKSYNLFPASNQFDVAEEMDGLDAATSDVSEPDMLWQFSHSKIDSCLNGRRSKITQKPYPKLTKTSEQRNVIPKLESSPLKKMGNGVSQAPHRNGRQKTPAAVKRKPASRN
ncbi:hypothetical protein Leryth_004736 [Lithospermum erythrorhizon]|nr:hypothetical protein Leryth_004736 [Lithospermum erythrorhizon]